MLSLISAIVLVITMFVFKDKEVDLGNYSFGVIGAIDYISIYKLSTLFLGE